MMNAPSSVPAPPSATRVDPDHSQNPAPTELAVPPIRASFGLGRIAGFFLLILLLVLCADWLLDLGFRRIRTSMFGVSNKIVNGSINAEIIISGSSRALCHYDAQLLSERLGKRVFNLGRNGSQTDMQVALLKTYLSHNAKPEVIVHNLDAFSFVTTKEIYDPAQYLPYLSEPEIYAAFRRFHPEIWKSRYLPLYGYLVEDLRFQWLIAVKALLGIQPAEDQILGFQPRTQSWSEDFRDFRERNPNGISFEIEDEGVIVLRQLAELCQERGIRLIFVYSPEYGEIQELIKNREQIFREFREIADAFSAELVDYSRWEHSFNKECFQNSQHLNALGARIFSEDLAVRLSKHSQSSKNAAFQQGSDHSDVPPG